METDYLPSAKFTKIFLSIVGMLVLFFVLQKYSPDALQNIFTIFNSTTSQADRDNVDAFSDYRSLDTDKDGLYDWEESLFGTDPKKSDSDGDGSSDSAEHSRADISIGPDGVATLAGTNGFDVVDSAVDSYDPSNLTDSLARDLYTSLSVIKQQTGKDLTPEDNDKLAEIAAESISEFTSKIYTSKDMIIQPVSDSASIQQFQSKLQSAWASLPISASDVSAMLGAIDSDSPIPVSVQAKLPSWSKFPTELLAIPTPRSVAPEYVAYINAVNKYLTILVAIGYNDTDPARAFSAVSGIEEALADFEKTEKALSSKLSTSR